MSWSSAASFYRQLASLLRAGLPSAQALHHLTSSVGGWHGARTADWSRGCASGRALGEQLAASGEEPVAAALVRAGERCGRLPELCDEIAALNEHRIALRSLLVGRLIYPTLLANMAALVWGAVGLVSGGGVASALAPIAGLWLAVALLATALWLARRSGLAARLALAWPARIVALPLIAANTCLVLRAGAAAGMLHHDALETASDACGNRVMRTRLRAEAQRLLTGSGENLATALAACGMPLLVVEQVRSGEIAGALEEHLARAARVMRESFRERSLWAARVAAGICYAIAAAAAVAVILGVAYKVYVVPLRQLEEL